MLKRVCRQGILLQLWWECTLMQPLWKTVEIPQKTKKKSCRMILQSHF